MGGVNIAQKLADDFRFDENLVVEDENRYEATGVEGEKFCRAGTVHIDDTLLEGDAYLGQADVGAVGPWAGISLAL